MIHFESMMTGSSCRTRSVDWKAFNQQHIFQKHVNTYLCNIFLYIYFFFIVEIYIDSNYINI